MKEIISNIYIIKECQIGEPSSCVYLVDTCSQDGLVLIDAGTNGKYLNLLKSHHLNPKDIQHCLFTHSHFDHVDGGLFLLSKSKQIQFCAHILDREYIEAKFKVESKGNLIQFRFFEGEKNVFQLGNYEFECVHIPGHTPGSVVYSLSVKPTKIIFVGDICGGYNLLQPSQYPIFKKSLKTLLDLDADILCDGHMNVIKDRDEVSKYIKACMEINERLYIGIEKDPKNVSNWFRLSSISYDVKIYDTALGICNLILKIDPNHQEAKKLKKEVEKRNPPVWNNIESYIKQKYGEII